jgi:hypothetical protein
VASKPTPLLDPDPLEEDPVDEDPLDEDPLDPVLDAAPSSALPLEEPPLLAPLPVPPPRVLLLPPHATTPIARHPATSEMLLRHFIPLTFLKFRNLGTNGPIS